MKVKDLKDLSQALGRSDKELLLHINRGGRFFYLVIR
jgi:hypothetical protein